MENLLQDLNLTEVNFVGGGGHCKCILAGKTVWHGDKPEYNKCHEECCFNQSTMFFIWDDEFEMCLAKYSTLWVE
ncbi:MAG: hypothetical protein KKE11_00370 [Gammaproteobacteria bacterium]|nr:hypothetical protein [Gammaproteobacteria bacterium]